MTLPSAATSFLRGRIKLRHLHLMLVLDEERSISRAAERLCISQAAVSKTRAEIEAGIGSPLFVRINRRLEFTEAGASVLQSARRIVAELQNLADEVALMKGGMQGTLTIGMRSISAQPFIAFVASAFKETHPRLVIRLIDADLPYLLNRLEKGDISLVVGRPDSEHAHDEIETDAILADPNVVIASPDHPVLRRHKVTWPELIQYRWCLTPEGFAGRLSRDHIKAHLKRLNLPFPSDLVEPTSFLMIVTLFQAGDYLSLAPLGVATELVQRGLARRVKVPPLGTIDPVCFMWRSDMPLSPAAKHFKDFATKLLHSDAAKRILEPKLGNLHVGRRFSFVDPASAGSRSGHAGRDSRMAASNARRLSSA